MAIDIEYIERYFDGLMTPEEIGNFEKKRDSDKNFAEQIRVYNLTRSVIREAARHRMKQHLDEAGVKKQENLAFIGTFLKYRLAKNHWYAIAASIVFVIAGLFAFNRMFLTPGGDSLLSLYDSYYKTPGTAMMISRGAAENNSEITWYTAVTNYNDRQFSEAQQNFSRLLSDTSFSRRSAAHFYLGICYLNLNMPDTAVKQFERVSNTSTFSEEATWYKGLSYLKTGNLREAEEIFQGLKKSPSKHLRKSAGKLIHDLSRLK